MQLMQLQISRQENPLKPCKMLIFNVFHNKALIITQCNNKNVKKSKNSTFVTKLLEKKNNQKDK